MDNLYDVLQVQPTATKGDIETAYKKLAEKYNPDLTPLELRQQCEDNLKKLNHAREILTKDSSRQQYDECLKTQRIACSDVNIERNTVTEDIPDSATTMFNSTAPSPWARYFARMFDFCVGPLLIVFLWNVFSPDTYDKIFGGVNSYVTSVIIYIGWLAVESLLISTWGTTPGKWIFNAKVIDIDGGKLKFLVALRRSFSVFVYGMGLSIPIVSIVMLIISYNKLKDTKNMGLTLWDTQSRSAVVIRKLNPVKIILSFVIAILIFYGINYYSFNNRQQVDAVYLQLSEEKTKLDEERDFLNKWKSKLDIRYSELVKYRENMKKFENKGRIDEHKDALDKYNNFYNSFNEERQQFEERRRKFNNSAEEYNKKLNLNK